MFPDINRYRGLVNIAADRRSRTKVALLNPNRLITQQRSLFAKSSSETRNYFRERKNTHYLVLDQIVTNCVFPSCGSRLRQRTPGSGWSWAESRTRTRLWSTSSAPRPSRSLTYTPSRTPRRERSRLFSRSWQRWRRSSRWDLGPVFSIGGEN